MTMCVRRIVAFTLTAGILAAMTKACPAATNRPIPPAQSCRPVHQRQLVHLPHCGPDRIQGKTFLTLEEALAQKTAVVHETKNVNELTIDNTSKNADVFIQAGDIVRRGRQ